MSMKKIVLFAGTTEGHRLCECFVQNKWQAEVFVATEYGREILPQAPNLHIHAGRLDMKQIYSQLTQIRPVCVLDATHPYADEVTKNIKEACQTAGFPYMRILRENTDMTENVTGSAKAHIRVADSMREAVDLLNDKPYLEKNILLTTGSKHLPDYTKIQDYQNRAYLRLLPSPEMLQKAVDTGFLPAHLIAMQGPFSQELNVALIKQSGIGVLVTKQSGKSGWFEEKISAAEQTGTDVIVIKRPKQEDGKNLSEAEAELKKLMT